MEHVSRARALFLAGYGCAQAVFAAFSDVTKVDEKLALRLGSSLGGGVGRMREVCGAVSGMALVLGAVAGYDMPDDPERKSAHYALVQSLAGKFREAHGSIVCRELLNLQKGADSPVSPARDAAFYQARPCLSLVETAAQILDEWLESRP